MLNWHLKSLQKTFEEHYRMMKKLEINSTPKEYGEGLQQRRKRGRKK